MCISYYHWLELLFQLLFQYNSNFWAYNQAADLENINLFYTLRLEQFFQV